MNKLEKQALTQALVLVDVTRELLYKMPPEARLQVFAALAGEFCRACGTALDGPCHCERDE